MKRICEVDMPRKMLARFAGLTLATLLLASGALAAQSTKIIVLDGDTIIVDGEHIRLANIDTPEIGRAKCDDELRRGLMAKTRLRQIIGEGTLEIARGDKGRMTDRYGRSLGRVLIDGRDVGEVLISEGLARRWDGRRHPWCQ